MKSRKLIYILSAGVFCAFSSTAFCNIVVGIDDGQLVSVKRENGKDLKVPALQVRTSALTPIFTDSGKLNVFGVEFSAPLTSVNENPSLQEMAISAIHIEPKSSESVKIDCSTVDDSPVDVIQAVQPKVNQYLGKCRVQFNTEQSGLTAEGFRKSFSDYFEVELTTVLKRASTEQLQEKRIDVTVSAKLNLEKLELLRSRHKRFNQEKFETKSIGTAQTVVHDLIGPQVCNLGDVKKERWVHPAVEIDCATLEEANGSLEQCEDDDPNVYKDLLSEIKKTVFESMFKPVSSEVVEVLRRESDELIVERHYSCKTGTELVLKPLNPDTIVKVQADYNFKD